LCHEGNHRHLSGTRSVRTPRYSEARMRMSGVESAMAEGNRDKFAKSAYVGEVRKGGRCSIEVRTGKCTVEVVACGNLL